MSRIYSLAYLTSYTLSPPESVRVAADCGYRFTSFRISPNFPGAPQQYLIDKSEVIRETKAVIKDTGVGVFDMELIRIKDVFDASQFAAFFEVSGELGARAVNVIVDDSNLERAAQHYAKLCEMMRPYELTADLEFMPFAGAKTAADALRVIELAGRPSNAGILIDALHVGRNGMSPEDVRVIPSHLLHYAQICDAEAGTHFTTEQMIHTAREERLFPGEGTIDVRGLFAALPSDLPISVEVVHKERMAHMTALEWARHCLQKTHEFVKG